ncbi:hypothetical protein OPV22_009924 [Ensete ventricosum]|uniref:Uncharacterized protein n=1 Tax=Ensete ventricosum TaxID=4639 RepID=A0AAV8REG2_ENSVE|nr:hypothetical protein OPV22_009924 [Ensete ventricosum]
MLMLDSVRIYLQFHSTLGKTNLQALRILPLRRELNWNLRSLRRLFSGIEPFQFGYMSANGAIAEALKGENMVHIIDFQIAQGIQWRLSELAKSCNVPFEFHGAPLSGCDLELEHIGIRPGEALACNFAFQLHHMPDESVSTRNYRDRLLRMIKSLSPTIVTLVEQESNTNTAPFFSRLLEIVDYYAAIFELIESNTLLQSGLPWHSSPCKTLVYQLAYSGINLEVDLGGYQGTRKSPQPTVRHFSGKYLLYVNQSRFAYIPGENCRIE